MFFKIFKIAIINSVIIFLLIEVLLRVFWQSPYVSSYDGAYLHEKKQNITFKNIDQIYQSDDSIVFRTGIYGEVIGPHHLEGIFDHKIFNVALGGSTTESALVQENYRWADLIKIPTLNFGKSRLNSSQTYENYAHILNHYRLTPKKVFLMDGSNNLSAYLSRGEKSLDNPNTKSSFYRFMLKHSYSLALSWTMLKKSDYLKFYKAQVALNLRIPLLPENELKIYWKKNKLLIDQTITKSLGKFKSLSKEKNIKLIVLSQPHAFFEDFSMQLNELRTTPVINGKRLSLQQSGWLMDEFNKVTLDVASKLGLNYFDVSECLKDSNSIEMYDAFHYTKSGSKSFAHCLNGYLEK